MTNFQHDPLYDIPDTDPAQHVAIDGDLLNVRLAPDTGDWRALVDDSAPSMTAAQERAFWIRLACTLAARRDAAREDAP